MKPTVASEKVYKQLVYYNLHNRRQKRKPQFEQGQSVKTADVQKSFLKADSANWSFRLHTKTEVIHDTIPS